MRSNLKRSNLKGSNLKGSNLKGSDLKGQATSVVNPPAKRAVSRKPRGRGHERRDEILTAAAKLFVQFGYAQVTTRRIAEAIGISQTALYVYFPNKDAILDELCDRCFGRLITIFDKELARGGDSLETLKRMMYAYVDFGIDNPDEYRIVFMSSHGQEAKMAALERGEEPAGMRCYLKMQEQVATLAEEGLFKGDPVVSAQALWAAGHGVVALLITLPAFPWAPRQALLDRVVEIQVAGLAGAA